MGNLKEGVKLKKKTKKKLKHSKLGTNTETTEAEKNGKVEEKAEDNGTSTTRNYRKKNEASDTDEKNKTEFKKEKKIKDRSKKPELKRYDVRRLLDSKKEHKERDKGDSKSKKDVSKKDNVEISKDEF